MLQATATLDAREFRRFADDLTQRMEDAARFGAGRAMLRLVQLIGGVEPLPPVRTGWGRRSLVIFVEGEPTNREEWERAKAAVLQTAVAVSAGAQAVRSIQLTRLPEATGKSREGVIRGEVVMAAEYMTALNFELHGTGGVRSTHASDQAGGRVGRGFFTEKAVRYMEFIVRDFARGVEVYFSALPGAKRP